MESNRTWITNLLIRDYSLTVQRSRHSAVMQQIPITEIKLSRQAPFPFKAYINFWDLIISPKHRQ